MSRRQSIAGGVVHRLPADLKAALLAAPKALAAWEDITPLARNQWIIWVIAEKDRDPNPTRSEGN